MNTVTKVFIVLNMIVAIAAGAVVASMYAYQENYKRRWAQDAREMKGDIDLLTARVQALSLDKVEAEANYSIQSNQLVDLQSRKAELEEAIKEREGKISNLETTISEITVVNQKQQQRIDQLTESLRIAEKRKSELNSIAQVARAVAFQLNVRLTEVEDDLANLEAALTRSQRTVFELEEDNKHKEALLALVRKHHPDIWGDITSSGSPTGVTIDALVAAVKVNPQGKQDLVMLTVGADEEVVEGTEFTVYRGNQYIVKIRVERVLEDMAACRVLPDTWNTKGLQIEVGDKATNRLF